MGGYAQTIDPLLVEEMGRRGDDEQIKVIVIMKSQYDRAQLNRRADYFVTRAEHREFVINELKAFTTASQYDLRLSLNEMQRQGLTSEPTVLWMANALSFGATKIAIENLAQRHDIEMIGYAIERNWIPETDQPRPASNTREITPNVTQVGADQVWALGYTGEGVVVAVVDTGVNYNHLDLADHLWDGGEEFPHHGYDVYNNDNDPMDDHSHGTHCAGTVCGDGTAGSQTGMAPNATLMCVKCINANGNGGAEMIAAGMQWALEHGADMFSMSLGVANSSVTERTLLRHTCISALDMGIPGAIAAGNEGDKLGQYPIPNNVRVPGSCPPPYMDDVQNENPGELSCSICIGAVDYNDNAAYFTSRGPVTWSNTEFADYPYNPGIGLIRPDVCAPGVDIKSANCQGNTGYTEMSGTSMATPCVAGCIALMLSKDINLSPADICRILEETAVPLAEGKSNIYGFGRVDVLAAVEAIQLGAIKYGNFAINDPLGNNDHKLNPGEAVTMDLTLENITEEPVGNVTAVLSSADAHVTITDNTVEFPAFAANQTLTVADAFAFSVDDEVDANYKVKFSIEISVDGEPTAMFNFKVPVYDYLLQYGATAVLNDDNANGLLNPGETADLRIFVDNVGNEMAQSLVGTLSTDYAFVTLNVAEGQYGTVGAGMMGYVDFNVTLDAAAPEDFVIPFILDLVDANGKHTELTFNYKNACNVIFSLHDSFGDGWQGNYLMVEYSDGTPTEQMTVESGNSATYTRELASGSTITLSWHNGQWTQECSFEITYEDGTIIFENSGGFNGTQTFEINCSGGGSIPTFCAPVRNLAYELDGSNVILTWEAPESGNPVGYEVYRETVLLGTLTELTFTDLDLADGEYNYCVYAVYDDCQSEFVCQGIVVATCAPVQNLDYALNDDLLFTFTWEEPEITSGLVEYQVYMNEEFVISTNELTCAFTITPGEYDVHVKAVFEACEEDTFVHVCLLPAVENLEYDLVSNVSMMFTWDALEGVSQYDVYINGEWVLTTSVPRYLVRYTALEEGPQTLTVKAVTESCFAAGSSTEFCVVYPLQQVFFGGVDVDGHLSVIWIPESDVVEYYEVECNGVTYQTSDTTVVFDPVVGANEVNITAYSMDGCSSFTNNRNWNVCNGAEGFDYSFNGDEVTITWDTWDTYETIMSNKVLLNGEEFVVAENSFSAHLENGAYSLYVQPHYMLEWCYDVFFASFDFEINNVVPEIHVTEVRNGLISTAWTEVEGALAYNLYRNDELIAENLTETAYNDTEMPLDTVHCYAVTAVFEKGVSSASEPACARYYTGLEEGRTAVSVFPNPTSDKVTIQCADMTQIEVYSIEGKLVRSLKVEDGACQIDGLESGVYMLRILRGDEVFVRRVVKM